MKSKQKPRLSIWQIWNMTFGFLGIQFGFALQNGNGSRILQTYGADVEHLSLFWLAAPLTGMIIQPIIGYYSDRTWNRLGRRHPFFLTGAIMTTIALFLMPNAGWLIPSGEAYAILSPMLIGAGMLMIMDASINIAMEPFRALIGDMLPDEQRTTGFSIQTFLIGVGAVVGSWLPYIMSEWLGISNEVVGNEIPMNVKLSFYVGGIILFCSVLWTIVSTKEYSPEELAMYNTAQDLKPVSSEPKKNGFMEIIEDVIHMPKAMLQLGICQFFSWFALFSMWVFTTPALAEHLYGVTDPASPAYNLAADKVGWLFGIYNFVAMLFALLLIPISKKLGRKMTHAVCLLLGGLGMISLWIFTDVNMMVISMVGIGIAWASILAMPYSILSTVLPASKMGTYMGIFNFFITLPQICNGLIHGYIVREYYAGHPIYALLTGGIFLLIASISVIFVREKEQNKIQTV